jgi:hypothetical protein
MTKELVLIVDVYTKICMTTFGKDHTLSYLVTTKMALMSAGLNPAASSSDSEGGLGGGGELWR